MKKLLTFVAALSLCAFALCGCAEEYTTESHSFYSMNTQAELVISDRFSAEKKNKFDNLCKDTEAVLFSVENSISVNTFSSSIYKFNLSKAGERVQIDETAYEVLSLAKEIYTLTEGYYNPAVYYSVQAYGFNEASHDSLQPDDRIPPESEIEKYNSVSSHFGELELIKDGSNFYAVKPQATFEADGNVYSMKIDLGGIGKGYAVDMVNGLIDEYGFENGYFSFGTSSITCKKHYKNGSYSLGMTNPRGAGSFASIKTENVCLSTSGDYQQYFLYDGIRYCHVFDPFTGRPIRTGIMSATVIGGSAAKGDALTTAIMAMGKERAVEFINSNLSNLNVALSIENGESFGIISNISDGLIIVNERYGLINTVSDGKIILGDN